MEEETTRHFLGDCEALSDIGGRILGLDFTESCLKAENIRNLVQFRRKVIAYHSGKCGLQRKLPQNQIIIMFEVIEEHHTYDSFLFILVFTSYIF